MSPNSSKVGVANEDSPEPTPRPPTYEVARGDLAVYKSQPVALTPPVNVTDIENFILESRRLDEERRLGNVDQAEVSAFARQFAQSLGAFELRVSGTTAVLEGPGYREEFQLGVYHQGMGARGPQSAGAQPRPRP